MITQNSTDTSTKIGHVELSAEGPSQERRDTTEIEKQNIKIQEGLMNQILNKEDLNLSAKLYTPEEADNIMEPQKEVNMALKRTDDTIHPDMINFGKIYVWSISKIIMFQMFIYVNRGANFTRHKRVTFIFGMGGLHVTPTAKVGADRISLPHLM